MAEEPKDDLEKQARNQLRDNLFVDFLYFLAHNKKWWLVPILIIFLLLGLLMFLSTSAVAPFIYPFF
jgi:hypothetical protein